MLKIVRRTLAANEVCEFRVPPHALPAAAAPAAMQQGKHAARNILRMMAGEEPLPFHYHNKGSLATIGRSCAVAQLGKWKPSGLIAWLAWLFIHVMFLIGFRNRLLVLAQWAWSFISYDRGARLITGPLYREADQPRAERPVRETQTI
jgi:NADH dehydrogenase